MKEFTEEDLTQAVLALAEAKDEIQKGRLQSAHHEINIALQVLEHKGLAVENPSKVFPVYSATVEVEGAGRTAEGTVVYTCILPPDIDTGQVEIWRGEATLQITGPGIKEGEEEEDCNPEDQIMVLVIKTPKEEEGHG